MIIAIFPIPNRVHAGAVIYGSKLDTYRIPPIGAAVNLQRGRNFIVPPSSDITNITGTDPITFFKVVSVWDNVLYEHVFMSWCNLHPYYLTNQGHPVELIPISVKRCGLDGIGSYLFVETIDNFLHDPIYKEFYNRAGGGKMDRVSSLPTYLVDCLQSMLDLLPTHRTATMLTDALGQQLSRRLTPVVPTQAEELYREITTYCGNPDELYGFLDAGQHYETGEHFSTAALSAQYEYGWTTPTQTPNGIVQMPNLDPITVLCLNTPTSITSTRLLPFIGDFKSIMRYLELADAASKTCPEHYVSILNSECSVNTSESSGLDELIEAFGSMPASDVVVYMKNEELGQTMKDWVRIEETHMFAPYVNDLGIQLDAVKMAAVRIAQELSTSDIAWDTITITKTWLDEIFMTTEIGSREQYGSNVTLPLYNLSSESLVNRQLIDVFINSM